MATIRASWKRVVQVKPYESETLELGSEYEVMGEGEVISGTQALARLLAEAGDELVMERLKAREAYEAPNAPTQAAVRRPAKMQDSPPDPKIVAAVKAGKTPVADPEGPDEYLGL